MSEPVASLELVGSRQGGQPFPVKVLLFSPIRDGDSTAFKCLVEIHPMQHRPLNIYGEGSLQALCLSAQHAVQTLATFVAAGGDLTHPEDGSQFDPNSYGFRLLGLQF